MVFDPQASSAANAITQTQVEFIELLKALLTRWNKLNQNKEEALNQARSKQPPLTSSQPAPQPSNLRDHQLLRNMEQRLNTLNMEDAVWSPQSAEIGGDVNSEHSDPDGDRLTVGEEARFSTNIASIDTNTDGITGLEEVVNGTNPLSSNSSALNQLLKEQGLEGLSPETIEEMSSQQVEAIFSQAIPSLRIAKVVRETMGGMGDMVLSPASLDLPGFQSSESPIRWQYQSEDFSILERAGNGNRIYYVVPRDAIDDLSRRLVFHEDRDGQLTVVHDSLSPQDKIAFSQTSESLEANKKQRESKEEDQTLFVKMQNSGNKAREYLDNLGGLAPAGSRAIAVCREVMERVDQAHRVAGSTKLSTSYIKDNYRFQRDKYGKHSIVDLDSNTVIASENSLIVGIESRQTWGDRMVMLDYSQKLESTREEYVAHYAAIKASQQTNQHPVQTFNPRRRRGPQTAAKGVEVQMQLER